MTPLYEVHAPHLFLEPPISPHQREREHNPENRYAT